MNSKTRNDGAEGDEFSVPVPKKKNFNLPKGSFEARISSVSLDNKNPQSAEGANRYKFIFEVNVPGMKKTDNLARKFFDKSLEAGSSLRGLVDKLKGEAFLEGLSGQQFDPRCLQGEPVELILDHDANNKSYEKPLVIVREVYPPGTLRFAETGKSGVKPTATNPDPKPTVIAPQFKDASAGGREAA